MARTHNSKWGGGVIPRAGRVTQWRGLQKAQQMWRIDFDPKQKFGALSVAPKVANMPSAEYYTKIFVDCRSSLVRISEWILMGTFLIKGTVSQDWGGWSSWPAKVNCSSVLCTQIEQSRSINGSSHTKPLREKSAIFKPTRSSKTHVTSWIKGSRINPHFYRNLVRLSISKKRSKVRHTLETVIKLT